VPGVHGDAARSAGRCSSASPGAAISPGSIRCVERAPGELLERVVDAVAAGHRVRLV
jgi:hypothetical protein